MTDVTIESNALIDAYIADTLTQRFSPDPILDPYVSRIVSVFNSLTRKDGYVLQHAVERALFLAEHIEVWDEPKFAVSRAADQLASEANLDTCLLTNLPYGIETVRTISRDLIVVNDLDGFGGSYDLKRGGAYDGSGKKRQLIRDTLVTQMLLNDYLSGLGYHVERVEARVVSIHGRTSLPPETTLRGSELDAHFNADIERPVREATAHFRTRIAELLPEIAVSQMQPPRGSR